MILRVSFKLNLYRNADAPYLVFNLSCVECQSIAEYYDIARKNFNSLPIKIHHVLNNLMFRGVVGARHYTIASHRAFRDARVDCRTGEWCKSKLESRSSKLVQVPISRAQPAQLVLRNSSSCMSTHSYGCIYIYISTRIPHDRNFRQRAIKCSWYTSPWAFLISFSSSRSFIVDVTDLVFFVNFSNAISHIIIRLHYFLLFPSSCSIPIGEKKDAYLVIRLFS